MESPAESPDRNAISGPIPILAVLHHEFHHAWESKTLDEDHILYAAMDAYLCLNIYKGWMKKQSPVSGSSKEASAKRKRKRDEDEVEDVDSDSQ